MALFDRKRNAYRMRLEGYGHLLSCAGMCWHVLLEGKTNRDAAWTYTAPKPAAREIANHIAFWHGVEVSAGKAG